MWVLGLTGSIGMGKSTASAMLRRLGVPMHDADASVHTLTGKGGAAVPLIEAAFPGTVKEGAVDRQALGQAVFGDPAALKRLERILHPLVGGLRDRFLARSRREGRRIVGLDVPLLLETGGERNCDVVVVVSAPAFLQRARVLARPGMTEEKLTGILSRQMPDAEKRRRADVVVPSGLGRAETYRVLSRLVADLNRGRFRRRPKSPLTTRKKPHGRA